MADIKQREVRMNARKKPGNKPRYHKRVHRQVKVEVFRAMQRDYRLGSDARIAVFAGKFSDERWHESKKDRFESGGEGL